MNKKQIGTNTNTKAPTTYLTLCKNNSYHQKSSRLQALYTITAELIYASQQKDRIQRTAFVGLSITKRQENIHSISHMKQQKRSFSIIARIYYVNKQSPQTHHSINMKAKLITAINWTIQTISLISLTFSAIILTNIIIQSL